MTRIERATLRIVLAGLRSGRRFDVDDAERTLMRMAGVGPQLGCRCPPQGRSPFCYAHPFIRRSAVWAELRTDQPALTPPAVRLRVPRVHEPRQERAGRAIRVREEAS